MMRSIFIIFLMTQWTKSIFATETSFDTISDDSEKLMEHYVAVGFDNSDSFIEELTTVNYETKPETIPPIFIPTLSTQQQQDPIVSSVNSLLTKLFNAEPTETIEALTEVPLISNDPIQDDIPEISLKKSTFKSIKPRLLDQKREESLLQSTDHKDDETIEALAEETTITPEIEGEINETNIDLGEEPTTIQPPTSKKPKKIEIYKTRPNELLRHYVEDSHLRSPIAALIDKKRNPLSKAKKLWKAALKPNSLLDIMVVSYDSEGIKSTYNLTNTRAMMSTLDRVREENATQQESKTYYSIIRTGQLIPYDSAIFLSTDNLPNDTEHQQPASMILLKKRIRLYLVIFDERNHTVNGTSTTVVRQTGFLGQLALRTGGDIIYVPNHAFKRDGEMGLITLIVGNRLKPIDSELKEVNENELKTDNSDVVDANEETTSIN
ncbi:CLUMA_CG016398, isoform A [Clunio marinus]|uniref:CLUMA_CG016398, isoform A n=1 Tax=Clunio marinus TaxID=568069 RepID=A0A1J1IS50_9DIPT|nr:CLUMA_CG016398, isoform A [Clunio marinus]